MGRSADSRRQRLQKFFSTFPDGWPGAGLLILRIAVAASAIAQGGCALAASKAPVSTVSGVGLLAIVSGLVFMAGFLTPVVGFGLTLGFVVDSLMLFQATDASRHASALAALYLAVMSMSLAFLGPGAFSVDARLFGRLEIIIPDGRRPPR